MKVLLQLAADGSVRVEKLSETCGGWTRTDSGHARHSGRGAGALTDHLRVPPRLAAESDDTALRLRSVPDPLGQPGLLPGNLGPVPARIGQPLQPLEEPVAAEHPGIRSERDARIAALDLVQRGPRDRRTGRRVSGRKSACEPEVSEAGAEGRQRFQDGGREWGNGLPQRLSPI